MIKNTSGDRREQSIIQSSYGYRCDRWKKKISLEPPGVSAIKSDKFLNWHWPIQECQHMPAIPGPPGPILAHKCPQVWLGPMPLLLSWKISSSASRMTRAKLPMAPCLKFGLTNRNEPVDRVPLLRQAGIAVQFINWFQFKEQWQTTFCVLYHHV